MKYVSDQSQSYTLMIAWPATLHHPDKFKLIILVVVFLLWQGWATFLMGHSDLDTVIEKPQIRTFFEPAFVVWTLYASHVYDTVFQTFHSNDLYPY